MSTNSQKPSELIASILQQLQEQASPAEQIGVTQQQLKALYALGSEVYHASYFEKAADLFRLLCFYEPKKASYWIALGAANQRLKNHESAIASFLMASFYDASLPEAKLYAAHSFIDIGDLKSARMCAEESLHLCKDQMHKEIIQAKAEALCSALAAHHSELLKK